jgi:hypothetical protein
MKRIKLSKDEIAQLDTGVELEREQNNNYSLLEMFTTTNRTEFYKRCNLDPDLPYGKEHLCYSMEFYPNWEKAFAKKHPFTGVVKYKLTKRNLVKVNVIITLGKMDIYDTLTLAGIEQDKILNRSKLKKAMDLKKVLEHCNWESYFAFNYKGDQIKLNEKDRKFIYDCIVNNWVTFPKNTRRFIPLEDAMQLKYANL